MSILQFLDYFARTLQSSLFHRIANKLKRACLFVIKHPFKTLVFIAKLYLALLAFLFLLVFLLSSAASAQVIYDNAGFVNTGFASGCDAIANPPLEQQAQDFEDALRAGNGTSGDYYRNFSRSPSLNTNGQYCQNRLTVDYEQCDYNHSTSAITSCTSKSKAFLSGWGNITQVPQCPPDSHPDYVVMGDQSDGSTYCFSPATLEAVDTCDSLDEYGNSQAFPMTEDVGSSACISKSDGSACTANRVSSVTSSSSGTTTYIYSVAPGDSGACYGLDSTGGQGITDTGEQCQELNGQNFCLEDPTLVCDENGVCPSGCGSFDIDGQQQFGCFGEDTDGDGNNDYELPDTGDGDGDGTGDGGGDTGGQGTDLTATNNLIAQLGSKLDNIDGKLNGIGNQLGRGAAVQFPGDDENGEMYGVGEPNNYDERNFGTVMEAAVNEMSQTPLSNSVNEFFEVTLTGTCPVYSANVPYMNTVITIDHFCGPVMNSVWPIISAVIILVFSVLAFRVAIL